MSPKLQSLLIALAIALPVDQLTKLAIEWHLEIGERIDIVPGFFQLTHVRNPGAALGLFGTAPTELRMATFVIVSLAAGTVLALLYRRVAPGDRMQATALSLILAGAAGNLIDRVWRGEVVDFLHLRLWGGYAWPDFNVADICIVMGVGSLIVDLLAREAQQRAMGVDE